MGGYYINISMQADSVETVRNAVIAVFEQEGFSLLQVDPAYRVVDNEDRLPDIEWYGVMISGKTDNGWVTVYVDDWKDSGFLAKKLSAYLSSHAIEIWVADDVNWGYTFWHNGLVIDRFADDPAVMTTNKDESQAYEGSAEKLGPILDVTDDAFQELLSDAHAKAGKFTGPIIGDFCEAIALPFEYAFTAYEYFFTDDPEDYTIDLPEWSQFRHMSFGYPDEKETLAD